MKAQRELNHASKLEPAIQNPNAMQARPIMQKPTLPISTNPPCLANHFLKFRLANLDLALIRWGVLS